MDVCLRCHGELFCLKSDSGLTFQCREALRDTDGDYKIQRGGTTTRQRESMLWKNRGVGGKHK